MTAVLQQEALDVAKRAIQRHESETEIADYIKSDFDKRLGSDWHCIVGAKFGSSISPQEGSFIYFTIGRYSILLFK